MSQYNEGFAVDQKYVLILLAALIFAVLLLVGLVLWLVFRLLNNEKVVTTDQGEDMNEMEKEQLKKRQEELKVLQGQATLSYCQNHQKEHAQGMCAICQDHFCDECLKEHDSLVFCETHFRDYLGSDWAVLDSVVTTSETPESAYYLYDFKARKWGKNNTPSIISTHYRIDIEGDSIESNVMLLVKKEQKEQLELELNESKSVQEKSLKH